MSNDFDTQAEIMQIRTELQELRNIIKGIAAWPDPWIDLKRACLMKGVSYNSLRHKENKWKLPRGGIPDKIINGKKVWRPQTIKEWILLGDNELRARYKQEEDG